MDLSPGAGAHTYSTPTSVSTVTQHPLFEATPGATGDSRMDDLIDLLMDRIKRGVARPAASRPMLGAAPTRVRMPAPEAHERPVEDALTAQARKAALRDIILRQAAAEQGPATRQTTFASGAINGLTLDPMAMNAYGRQLYLPQGSAGGNLGLGEEPDSRRVYYDAYGNILPSSLGAAGSRLV